jgi:hypothetical protein
MDESGTVKVRFWFVTRWLGASTEKVVEYDRDEWESMTRDERDEAAMDFAADNGLDVGWHEEG